MDLTGGRISKATSAIITSKQDAEEGCFSQYHATLSSGADSADCMKTEYVSNERNINKVRAHGGSE